MNDEWHGEISANKALISIGYCGGYSGVKPLA